jgi:hypothetical protein
VADVVIIYNPSFRGQDHGHYPGRGDKRWNPGGSQVNAVSFENRLSLTEMSQMTETTAVHNNTGQAFGRASYANNQTRNNSMDTSTTHASNTTRICWEILAVVSSNWRVTQDLSDRHKCCWRKIVQSCILREEFAVYCLSQSITNH